MLPKLFFFLLVLFFFVCAFIEMTQDTRDTNKPRRRSTYSAANRLLYLPVWLADGSIPSSDQRRALWQSLPLALEKMVLLNNLEKEKKNKTIKGV